MFRPPRGLRFVLVLFHTTLATLLYPESSVLQVTSSISLPMADLAAPQKGFFDWGFQMNLNMPFNLSSFYMTPIWNGRSNVVVKRAANGTDPAIEDVYLSFENLLERHAFHRSCLQRMICELALHPFQEPSLRIIADIIKLVLTPSLLRGKGSSSSAVYDMAQKQGEEQKSCHHIYSDCADDILNEFTKINYN